jgi:putative PIN family toxin of toxin-antitoxin system
MSLRVVYDTNVVVSAALNTYGTASTLLSLALNRQVTLCLSSSIFREYQEVLVRPKFGLPLNTVAPLLGAIRRTAVMVTPKQRVSKSPDEPDNRFLECAQAANADYLVTSNTRHFPFAEFLDTRIVTPAIFARLVAAHLYPQVRSKARP